MLLEFQKNEVIFVFENLEKGTVFRRQNNCALIKNNSEEKKNHFTCYVPISSGAGRIDDESYIKIIS